MVSTISHTCVNCHTPYNPNDLYCSHCGYILPHVLDNDATSTRQFGSQQSKAIDLQWGTSYFHHRARLFLRVADTESVIPVPLHARTVILGRAGEGGEVDVDLTPFDAVLLGVSRRHVRIERARDVLQVNDLESSNGTYLNRDRLTPGATYTLRNRGVLQLGRLMLRIQFA